MTASELNPDARKLIDARLDAIDRALLATHASRSERRSIVDEVETQIFELLARRSPVPSLEDVTAVLASLDPPESYLPEVDGARTSAPPKVAPSEPPLWRQLPGKAVDVAATIAPWLVGAAALLVVDGFVVAIVAASEGAIPFLVTLGVIVWLNYAGVRRFLTWSATRQGRFLDDLRQSVGAWLISPNSPAA